ncbi:MAG: hypothetical protein A2133_02905 [Actinobacteria bacterium RBG_16_64_13]|nr:MAG: hypothetical protein A2133_02905 [Actinobacteria bacterium RBG_16_64_13]
MELADDDVLLESAAALSDRSETRGAVISLVNFRVSAYQGSGLAPPDLLDSMELLVLFSFRFRRYEASLQNLYRTVRLFHGKPAYTAMDTHPDNAFPAHIDKLFFTLVPLEFDALNDLWRMLGGQLWPSVLYSMRMVRSKNL